MPARRVAVTGMGVISALGADCDTFGERLFSGSSAVRPLTCVEPGTLRFRNGAEVKGYDPDSHFDSKTASVLDLFAQYGVVAARQAVRNADFRPDPARTAVITGTGGGGQPTIDNGYVDLYRKNQARVNPFTIPRIMANSAASHISLELGITGPVYTVSTACSSSNHAIGQAFHAIRTGLCDAAIAGGSEAVFTWGFLKSWEAMRVISPDTCRPFSKNRQGLILGDGGAMLVLEEYEKAVARGASIRGEIVGFGMSADAYHITHPSGTGAAQAMRQALGDAGVGPDSIGYINAHGTGTTANDREESSAIHKVFGEHARHICVSSTKSMHGHTLGAAGAIEAMATVLALERGVAPPTINFTEPDPECDLNVVPNAARPISTEYAMSNSFAFGGLNAVIVFRRGAP